MGWRFAVSRVKAEVTYYRRVATDPRTPWISKVLIGVAIAYLLSPIDIIPDFVPVLGYLDDVLLVAGLVWLAAKLVPDCVKREASRFDPD